MRGRIGVRDVGGGEGWSWCEGCGGGGVCGGEGQDWCEGYVCVGGGGGEVRDSDRGRR